MKILITGAAGFIGFHLAKHLSKNFPHWEIVGIDNLNNYYDVSLKENRLEELGIHAISEISLTKSDKYPNFRFIKTDICDLQSLAGLFNQYSFDIICHLAAQAGVRYSFKEPRAYLKSNIEGFYNILEQAQIHPPKLFLYASSSSVYGNNRQIPFNETLPTNSPTNIYAATKISNELLAYTASSLYKLPTIGLRFFTVYGSWGRPDMALFKFINAILQGKKIDLYNYGKMFRDFTHISDIVKGIEAILQKGIKEELPNFQQDNNFYKIYNIGCNSPISLLDFIKTIEEKLQQKAIINYLPMQPGEMEKTWADVNLLREEVGISPTVSLKEGVSEFVDWYLAYYQVHV